MKKIILIISIVLISKELYGEYDSIGIRDPMVKTIIKKTDTIIKNNQKAKTRTREIYNVLKNCKIEGVIISNKKKLVLINDRLLAEGDKILPDCDIRIYKINDKFLELSLDGQIVTYALSFSK